MNRSTAYRTVAAGLLLATAAAVAQAAPVYRIAATTDGKPVDISQFANLGFSIQYEDTDDDHRFSLSELLTFTPVFDGTNYFEELVGLPDLPGLVGTGSEWLFRDSMPDTFGQALETDWRAPAGMFTPYTSDPFAGSVPEPSTWALSVLSLAALGFARRHAQRPNGSVSR